MPDIIQQIRDTYASNPAAALNMLPELFKQYDEGLIPMLPCKAGTRLFGVTLDRKHIVEFIADEFIYSGKHWFVMGTHGEGDFDWQDCYFTRAEAEKALEEREKCTE